MIGYIWYTVLRSIPIFVQGTCTPRVHSRAGRTVQGELDRVSQTLTGRIRQLAERYATPLPQLTDVVATLTARVDGHLKKMGAVWK